MRAAESTAKPVRPDVNVTPLIDVLLALLVIFMLLAPLRPARFKALIPEPPGNDTCTRGSPRSLVVEVGGDLRLRLIRGATTVAEGSVADPGPVAARLADEFKMRREQGVWKADFERRHDLAPDERIERIVFVRAPRSVRYGEVARVIDRIKGAGAQPIGLHTDELEN
jgi:biopolymer transport protein ExbD